MDAIRNSVLAGLFFGIVSSFFFFFVNGLSGGLIIGAVTGLAFGGLLYLFITSKTVQQQTRIETPNGEIIIHSGAANHLLGRESVGGKLYLLTDRLQFKSHNFNIQTHEQIIPLAQIKEIGYFNSAGIVPNGLLIIILDGKTEKFVVNNRKLWKEEINKLK